MGKDQSKSVGRVNKSESLSHFRSRGVPGERRCPRRPGWAGCCELERGGEAVGWVERSRAGEGGGGHGKLGERGWLVHIALW